MGFLLTQKQKASWQIFTVGVKKLHTMGSLKNTLRHVNFGWFFAIPYQAVGKTLKAA